MRKISFIDVNDEETELQVLKYTDGHIAISISGDTFSSIELDIETAELFIEEIRNQINL